MYYQRKDIAEILNISSRTLQRYISAGRIKIEPRKRLSIKDLQKFEALTGKNITRYLKM